MTPEGIIHPGNLFGINLTGTSRIPRPPLATAGTGRLSPQAHSHTSTEQDRRRGCSVRVSSCTPVQPRQTGSWRGITTPCGFASGFHVEARQALCPVIRGDRRAFRRDCGGLQTRSRSLRLRRHQDKRLSHLESYRAAVTGFTCRLKIRRRLTLNSVSAFTPSLRS